MTLSTASWLTQHQYLLAWLLMVQRWLPGIIVSLNERWSNAACFWICVRITSSCSVFIWCQIYSCYEICQAFCLFINLFTVPREFTNQLPNVRNGISGFIVPLFMWANIWKHQTLKIKIIWSSKFNCEKCSISGFGNPDLNVRINILYFAAKYFTITLLHYA